jgi:hypothetical protein
MEFKDERVQRVCEAMHELWPDYQQKKAQQEYNWLITTIANRFVEDRHAIFAHIGGIAPEKVPSGLATIQRRLNPTANRATADCPSCPGVMPSESIKDKPLWSTANPSHFATVSLVLKRFNNNVGIMIIFCQQNKIKLGRAKLISKVAERIVAHYQGQTNQNEEE